MRVYKCRGEEEEILAALQTVVVNVYYTECILQLF